MASIHDQSRLRRFFGGLGCKRLTGLLALVILVIPAALYAQDVPSSFGSFEEDPDFLFREPRGTIGLRGGMFFHRADSDLFTFTEERFTVDRSDYRAASFGVELSIWLGDRWEVNAAVDGSRVTLDSEYRDFVEDDGSEDGLPIRQQTRLTEGPVFSVGGRWYALERGDRLGQFAWTPSPWNAFLGGGGAVSSYVFELSGDFVDEIDSTISTNEFRSSGTTFLPFLSAGVERSLSDRSTFVIEGRYLWGSEDLGRDFADDFIDPLDLSGLRVTAGIFLRY